jgi:hypothetical protein
MLNDLIRERLSEMIQKAAQDLLDQAKAMEPVIMGDGFPASYSYAPFTEYGFPPMPEEANTVEGSLVEPITDEGRLLE